MMRAARCTAATASLCLFAIACGGGSSGSGNGGAGGGGGGGDDGNPALFCTTKPFTPPAQSPYRLPFAPGSTYVMFQGNCPANPQWGHHGKFAYDFEMPNGTPVHAMRGGTVIFIEDRYLNSDHTPGHENGVWVLHADGTVANYLHFSPSSVVVVNDSAVEAGFLLGYSGNSGGSDRPHLHVEAFATRGPYVKANTVPITFNNAGGATAASGELIQGNSYTALELPDWTAAGTVSGRS